MSIWFLSYIQAWWYWIFYQLNEVSKKHCFNTLLFQMHYIFSLFLSLIKCTKIRCSFCKRFPYILYWYKVASSILIFHVIRPLVHLTHRLPIEDKSLFLDHVTLFLISQQCTHRTLILQSSIVCLFSFQYFYTPERHSNHYT